MSSDVVPIFKVTLQSLGSEKYNIVMPHITRLNELIEDFHRRLPDDLTEQEKHIVDKDKIITNGSYYWFVGPLLRYYDDRLRLFSLGEIIEFQSHLKVLQEQFEGTPYFVKQEYGNAFLELASFILRRQKEA